MADTTAARAGNRAGRWFGDRTIGTKVLSLLGVCLAAATAVGVTGLVALDSVNDRVVTVHEQAVIPLEHLAEGRDAVSSMRQRVLLHLAGPVQDKPRREAEIIELDDRFDAELEQFAAATGRSQVSDELAQAVQAYREFRDGTILPVSRGDQQADVATVLATCDALYAEVVRLGAALTEQTTERVDREVELAAAATSDGRRTIVLILLLGAAVAIGLGLYVSRLITRPLRQVDEVLGAVADGDLTRTASVSSRDEVGVMAANVNRAAESMRVAVETIGTSARALAGSSEELSTVSQQIAASADQASAQATWCRGGGAGVAQRADGGDGCGGDGREHPGDRAERERGGEGGRFGGGGGVSDERDGGEAGGVVGGDLDGGEGDHLDRGADEPAGVERDDRGGSCW